MARKNIVVVTDDSLFCVKKNNKTRKYTYVKISEFKNYLKNNSKKVDVLIIKTPDGFKTCILIPEILKYKLSKKTIIIANINPNCTFANYMYFKIHCILKEEEDDDQIEKSK